MSSMFRSLVTGGLMAVMAMAAMVAAVQAETPAERQVALRKAGRAAIYGPEAKELKVAGHEFNVKKAKLDSNHEGVTITGQLSHCLSLRKDDQFFYTIKKINGAVFSIETRIDRGGLAPLVSKVASDDVARLVSKLGQKIDGKWETAAELIVAQIAKVAPDIDSPASNKRPAPYKPSAKKK